MMLQLLASIVIVAMIINASSAYGFRPLYLVSSESSDKHDNAPQRGNSKLEDISAPIAIDTNNITNVNTPVVIALKAGSSDPNAFLTASIVTNPFHGNLSDIDQNLGVVTYTPNPSYSGYDNFTFRVNDGKTESDIGTVSILVYPRSEELL